MSCVHPDVQLWSGCDHKCIDLPPELTGATFFRGPFKALARGTVFKITLHAPATLFVFVDHRSGCNGGFVSQLRGVAGWQLHPQQMSWSLGTMDVLYRQTCTGTVLIGRTTTEETIFGVAVQPEGE